MFSSTNTLNPFPQQQYYFPSSSHPHHLPPPPPPPILNQEVAATATVTATASATVSDDILFHHDPLSTPFLLNISPLIPDPSVINLGVSNSAGTMTKQDMCNLYGDHNHHHHDHHHHLLDGGVPKFLPKKPMKKDRHSKIYTAQGLRDRRVRLSIEIAREFFDLQDMLGFDKASKTLEWLLSKSKKAIKDLARTKLSSTSCAKSSSLTSECEGDEEEQEQEQEDKEQANNEVGDNNENILEGTVVSKSKKMLKEKNMRKFDEAAAALQHLRTAKESRAKARARARERTREKMCTVLKIHDPKKCPPTQHPSTTNPSSSQILNQLRTMNQFHGCERSSPRIVATAEIIEAMQESSSSIMSRRKLQKLNEISTKGGQTSNDNNNTNNNMFCPNLPQNWDINSPLIATTRPSFCTITNMNLSTELQIYGKTMGGQ